MPLNQPVGSHRRFFWVRSDLAKFKKIKDTFGGTINDVVLAVVAGTMRTWLHSRGVRTEGLELRAQVPVSVRAADEHGQLGNKIAVVRGPVPVYVEDPVKRLEVCRQSMEGIKHSKQALGAEVISRFNDFAPPTLLAQAARVNFSTRLFNLVVTNVPGPQIPLYVLGRELEDCFPVGFLPPEQALFVAIMSYNGEINFGLLGDYDLMYDLEDVATALEDSIAELVEAADEEAASEREDRSPAAPDLTIVESIRYHLELTPAQLKITHTALRSLLDDFGHDEPEIVELIREVLAKLPDEHAMRAIRLDSEFEALERKTPARFRPRAGAAGRRFPSRRLSRKPRAP